MARESHATGVERLGRYEILGEIASGGMATVFLGRVSGAKGFQRLVAIKRLHPHLEGEEDFVSMFLDEARLAAKIRHQNVVGTLDVEDQAGLYIVMEYIEGDRLLGLLRHAARTGERIPHNVVVRIALDTLAGLHAAHELNDDDGEPLGLVHRDVSPQNILIGIDGVARLTDFGIAKATSRLTVTRDGQLKGKIAYMAPEQTKRVEIDRRVDLFAMGIITWEMFTAKKLFTGESDVEVLNQLLFEPIPRLRESAQGIPAAIDIAVMKALERDPAKRYASASEFADELERASKVLGGPANAKAVAAHVQKVSAEKLARDRARWTSPGSGDAAASSRVQRRPTEGDTGVGGEAGTPVSMPTAPRARTVTGANLPPPAPPPSPPPMPARRPTQTGMPVAQLPPAPTPPVMTAGPSLIDDDEDVPTQAGNRTVSMGQMLQAGMDTGLDVAPGAPSADDDLDDGATMVGSLAGDLAAARGEAPPATANDAPVSAPAIGPPPLELRNPVASPTARPAAVTLDAQAPPKRGVRGTVIGSAAALVLVAGGAAVWSMRRPAAPGPTATSAVRTPASVPAPPVAPPPVIAPTPAPVPEPTPVVAAASADASVVAPPSTEGTAVAAPPVDTGHGAPPAVAVAPQPEAPTETSRPHHPHGHDHPSEPAQPLAHAATPTTPTAPVTHPTEPAVTPTPPPARPHPATPHPHEDDPFGNDNPYQR